MTAARKLELDMADDPVWAAACAAPPCTELPPPEELEAFEEAIEEYHAGHALLVSRVEAGLDSSRPGAGG